MPYTSVSSYSFLYTFALNMIINTRFFRESISPAIKAIPSIVFKEIFN